MVDFEKDGFVSIWAGLSHQDETVDLLKDLCGVEYYDVDFQEGCVAPDGRLEPIESLVKPLSFSASFEHDVLKKAKEFELDHVAWLVMQLNYSFDPDKSSKEMSDQVKFLGSFSFEDDGWCQV